MCQIHSHKFLNFFEKTVWRESPNNPKPWASLTVYSGSILVAGSPMKGTVGVWEAGCFDQLHITTQAVDPALSSPPTYVKFDVIFRKTFLVSECTDLVFSCSDTIQPLQAQGRDGYDPEINWGGLAGTELSVGQHWAFIIESSAST